MIHIRTSSLGDWIAVYRDRNMLGQGHSISVPELLGLLEIEFTEEEMQLDDIGELIDGSGFDPFPDTL